MSERDLFEIAFGIGDPDQRSAYLDRVCAGNPELRDHLAGLLSQHGQLGSFLESPAPGAAATVDHPSITITERPGTIIGPYKLMEQIGEGGMGLVFVAEQQRPVRRKVALKVIKPGMDTREVVARFEAERQALALMDHPHIAKVLDGGETTGGRPYFVMELVKGVRITDYCDENRLTPRQRLELLVNVCQAVQHAHQKGIIHRDLKPSNVLVTSHDGVPVVKVIDFGISKAIGQQLTDKTIYTQFAQLVGTPTYMSPEQAGQSGLDIDTRTDIYALGVLLYELLTGTTPFNQERLRTAGYEEIRRIIREEEPPKPSTRISTLGPAATTVSTRRKSDPKQLSHLCRGELDWIVMKCLEKDRNRRYETANAVAMDLQRYLADEPVLACPPSAGYRLRKFAHKYRTPLRMAGLFVVFLMVAAAVSTWQAVRATLAEKRALVERDRAAASFRMARDAVHRLFTHVSQDPTLKTYGLEKFRTSLLQDAQGFYERFIREQFDSPGVRYDLALAYYRLGEIHRELGEFTAAEDATAKAVALLGALVQAQPGAAEYRRDLANGYVALGLVYYGTARSEKAESAFQRALAIQEQQAAAYPQAAEYRYALAKTYRASGYWHHGASHPEIAAARYQQALDILNKLVEDDPVPEHQSLLATTQVNLATVYNTKGWFDKAEPVVKEAQRIYRRLMQDQPDALPEHWQTLGRSYAILGMAYRGQGQTEKAEAVQQQAMDIFEKLANEHPGILEYAYNVGRCYTELGLTANRAHRPDVAMARYDKAIAILEGVLRRGYRAGRNHLLNARIDRTTSRAARGDHAEAAAEAEALAQQPDLNPAHLYDLSCTFSQSSAAVDRDVKLSAAERARLKASYADRAMDFLRRAIAGGWQNPDQLKADPDIDPLRARDDFRKLLADLEAKTKE
jgi:serine/threonine protein kinase/tetratricopeptide (TPR) repeat protein